MRDRLAGTLLKIIQLLISCGERTRAEWFQERLAVVENEHSDSERFHQVLRELRSILAGMGSLSDLSLNPTSGSRMTRQEARDQQWELVEDLDEAIAELLRDSR